MLSNPLSLDENSPWVQYHKVRSILACHHLATPPTPDVTRSLRLATYQDMELIEEINTDVQRLYPDGCGTFFEDEGIRRMTVNGLFVWCRMHEDVSYRQGMHELMAPIIFCLEGEKLAATAPAGAPAGAQEVSALLSAAEVEADAFLVFEAVMRDMKQFFLTHAPARIVAGDEVEDDEVSPALSLVRRVQSKLLPRVDAEVGDAMASMDVQPQVYGLRWVRLLFGREFEIEDVLVLWDGLFAARSGLASGGAPVPLSDSIEAVGVVLVCTACRP